MFGAKVFFGLSSRRRLGLTEALNGTTIRDNPYCHFVSCIHVSVWSGPGTRGLSAGFALRDHDFRRKTASTTPAEVWGKDRSQRGRVKAILAASRGTSQRRAERAPHHDR